MIRAKRLLHHLCIPVHELMHGQTGLHIEYDFALIDSSRPGLVGDNKKCAWVLKNMKAWMVML